MNQQELHIKDLYLTAILNHRRYTDMTFNMIKDGMGTLAEDYALEALRALPVNVSSAVPDEFNEAVTRLREEAIFLYEQIREEKVTNLAERVHTYIGHSLGRTNDALHGVAAIGVAELEADYATCVPAPRSKANQSGPHTVLNMSAPPSPSKPRPNHDR